MTILKKIITKLESAHCQLSKWFDNNCMKVNYDKFHLLIPYRDDDVYVNIGMHIVEGLKSEK